MHDKCCSHCGSSKPCGCRAPRPYYLEEDVCLEDNKEYVICNQYSFSVTATNSWNVPLCGQIATLDVEGIKNISLGTYIWNINYGYFQVSGYNVQAGTITIVNPCLTGNSPAGTVIPACTSFTVTDPPSELNFPTSLYPYVAVDFTAPSNGDCIDIIVTTINGLISNHNVQIGSGTYLLSSIGLNNVITICNQGSGILPGTPVYALDGAGQFQYPVVVQDTNPCVNSSTTKGTMIVCDGGVQHPVTGTITGSVWVLGDPTTGEGSYVPIDIPATFCTVLITCLNIIDTVAVYTLFVADTSGFAINDLLVIDDKTFRAKITNIIDSTHMTVTIIPTPSSTYTLPVGTTVCLIPCCEQIQNQLTSEVASNTSTNTTGEIGGQAEPGFLDSVAAAITITNTTTQNKVVMFVADVVVEGDLSDYVENGVQFVSLELNADLNGGGPAIVRKVTNNPYSKDPTINSWHHDIQVTYHLAVTIAPGATYNLQVSGTARVSDITYLITKLQANISAIAITV